MIHVEDLHKSFEKTEVLRGVFLSIEKGEVLSLMGMSGYGKSVLLKHIAGLMRPDRGRILVDGEEVTSLGGGRLERLRSRLGFLFQGGALFDSLTIGENVGFPLKEKTSLTPRQIRERVRYELEQVGLTGAEDKYPAQVSGGMIKRAALARALVRDPEIMLFDEPTTGLDPIIGRAILTLIASCHERLVFTGIIVTHQIPQVFEIVNRAAFLHEGKIRMVGTPEEMMASEDPVVRQFISGSVDGPIRY